jgi:hypothetical protein
MTDCADKRLNHVCHPEGRIWVSRGMRATVSKKVNGNKRGLQETCTMNVHILCLTPQ